MNICPVGIPVAFSGTGASSPPLGPNKTSIEGWRPSPDASTVTVMSEPALLSTYRGIRGGASSDIPEGIQFHVSEVQQVGGPKGVRQVRLAVQVRVQDESIMDVELPNDGDLRWLFSGNNALRQGYSDREKDCPEGNA